jgi:hypothetical protein
MGVISTQGIEFQLVANGQILDLFQDEDIKLSDNVTGLFDLGIIPADFTRQITLPGTKKNNAFFEHVYDISVLNPDTFATNIKVPAYLDFGGLYLSQGYLQLNKVVLYANKFIDSYEVTIFGAVSSFARQINRSYLTDLSSLSQYNHTSSYSNISASWAGELFSGSIIYPLAEYGQKMKYTSGDLFFGIDDNEGGLSVQNFKPSIKAKLVWDAIFNQAGYTYSSSFIDNGGLDDVYLVCNRALKYPIYSGVNLETLGVVSIAPISASGQTDLNIPKNTVTNLPWYNIEKDPSNVIGDNVSYTLNVTSSLKGILTLNVKLSGSIGAPVTEFIVRDTGSLTQQSLTTLVNFNQYFADNTYEMFAEGANGQNKIYKIETQFTTGQLDPGTYYFGIQWRDTFSAPYNNFTFVLDPDGKPISKLQITQVEQAADGRIMDIPLNMPFGTNGIKQIDFLTSIQKKFNLVMYPSKTSINEFIVESFNKWYNTGRRWDFNKYVNLNDKIEVTPANNLAVNELNFTDTLDTDYISQQFSKEANREFGKQYYTDTENFFSQGKFEVKTSVASTQLLQITGTGLSGSVSGLNPIVTQYSAGSYYFTNINAAREACYTANEIEIFTADGEISIGQTAYYDQYGTQPVTGFYFFSNGLQIYRINVTTGVIGTFATLCSR